MAVFAAPGETEVMFSYEVEWRRSGVRWASRWDIYLAMTDVQIHWFSIINSVVVVFFLSGKGSGQASEVVDPPPPPPQHCHLCLLPLR